MAARDIASELATVEPASKRELLYTQYHLSDDKAIQLPITSINMPSKEKEKEERRSVSKGELTESKSRRPRYPVPSDGCQIDKFE